MSSVPVSCGSCGSREVSVKGSKPGTERNNNRVFFAECLKCGRVEDGATRREASAKLSTKNQETRCSPPISTTR